MPAKKQFLYLLNLLLKSVCFLSLKKSVLRSSLTKKAVLKCFIKTSGSEWDVNEVAVKATKSALGIKIG